MIKKMLEKLKLIKISFRIISLAGSFSIVIYFVSIVEILMVRIT